MVAAKLVASCGTKRAGTNVPAFDNCKRYRLSLRRAADGSYGAFALRALQLVWIQGAATGESAALRSPSLAVTSLGRFRNTPPTCDMRH